jgi:hypothetical protein
MAKAMKLSDIVCRVIIDHRKLTEYALSPFSPSGRHKAIVFEQALGFTRDNYADLIEQIEKNVLDAPAAFHGEDEFGHRYTVDITVHGTEGRWAVFASLNLKLALRWFSACVPVGLCLMEQMKRDW